MSLTITTDVFCDGCGVWVHGCTHPTKARAREAREIARGMDWSTKRGKGKLIDLCPDCAKADLTNGAE